MTKQNSSSFFRSMVLALMLIIVCIMQNTAGLSIELFSFPFLAAVPFVVATALGENEISAAVFGFIAGLVLDLVAINHMGFNCIVLSLIALLCALTSKYLFTNTILTSIIHSAFAIFSYVFLYWLLFTVFAGVEGGGALLFSYYLPSAVVTLVLSPFVYIFVRWVKKIIG